MVLLCALWMVVSCATISGMDTGSKDDELKAENRLMRKNRKLALRENEVLKTENMQYRAKVNKLNAALSDLRVALESLHCQYNEDMTRINEAYDDLSDQLMWLEETSDEKILNLTETNLALEKKYADDVSALNEQLKKQQAAFTSERELLQTKYETKVKALEDQLSLSTQELNEKDIVIKSMETSQAESQVRITNLEKIVQEQDQIIKKGEKDFQELLKSSQNLQKIIEEKQAMIDSLNQQRGSVPEPSKQNGSQ